MKSIAILLWYCEYLCMNGDIDLSVGDVLVKYGLPFLVQNLLCVLLQMNVELWWIQDHYAPEELQIWSFNHRPRHNRLPWVCVRCWNCYRYHLWVYLCDIILLYFMICVKINIVWAWKSSLFKYIGWWNVFKSIVYHHHPIGFSLPYKTSGFKASMQFK